MTPSKPKIRPASAFSPTLRTAKLFKNGRSQAVRLPKEFRFEGDEVSIRRDPASGEVVLIPASSARKQRRRVALGTSPALNEEIRDRPDTLQSAQKLSLQELFAIFDQAEIPDDLFERSTSRPRDLKLFE